MMLSNGSSALSFQELCPEASSLQRAVQDKEKLDAPCTSSTSGCSIPFVVGDRCNEASADLELSVRRPTDPLG